LASGSAELISLAGSVSLRIHTHSWRLLKTL